MTKAQLTTHRLSGLQPEPLASYLSALGVLRLVTEQVDSTAAGYWSSNGFNLESALSKEELLSFFLSDYAPTPLTSPWNGGSGYFPNDNKDAVTAIECSDEPRFRSYRETISTVRRVLAELKIKEKPETAYKPTLLQVLRSRLNDDALRWLDATSALGETDDRGETSVRFAPLLGTGGNDGRLEFSNNFMQRLVEFFLSPKLKPAQSKELLSAALFGELGRYKSSNPVGQFDPGSAGGVNLGVGFEAKASLNPWYYIFMIEGAIILASSTVGRYRAGRDRGQGSAFPFTVTHLGAGHGKLAQNEGNRQEIWLPLWSRPTRYQEVSKLFAEGRAQNGSKQARNPIEFSLALTTHGTTRGLSGFTRFAFLQRNGKSFFATPLGYYPVRESVEGAGLIRRLERYFSSTRGVITEHSHTAQTLMRRYDSSVLDYLSASGRKLTPVLERLGELHRYIARNEKLCEKIRTFPELSKEWADLCRDESSEFHLAYSLASLGQGRVEAEFSLRAHLTPYNPQKRAWEWDGYIPRWTGRDLSERMLNLLYHRLRVADRVGFVEDKRGRKPYNSPIRGAVGAALSEIERFLEGALNEERLENLLFGLVLLSPHSPEKPGEEKEWLLPLPYLVCKLALHQGIPMRRDLEGDEPVTETAMADMRDTRIPPVTIPRSLATGNPTGALNAARRFLLGRPLAVPFSSLQTVNLSPARLRKLAAALVFPISDRTYRQLYDRMMLANLKTESDQSNDQNSN